MYDAYNLDAPDAGRWWEAPPKGMDEHGEKARAQSLVDTAKALENSQRSAHEQNLWNARLYSNRELSAFDWGHGVFYNTSLTPVSLIGENLCMTVVDTMVSMVAKERVKAQVTPRGASYKRYRQAKKLDKWLYGEFVRLKLWEATSRVFKDATVFGFGCLRVDVEDGKPCVRRVFPDDLIVDQQEAAANGDGTFCHIYERRCRRVEEVEAEYGLDPGTISSAAHTEYLGYRSPGRGWCIVVEGYHLGYKGQDGRRVVAVDGGYLLLDEPWEYDRFPYVWFHFDQPLSGFYWPGAVERALPYQIRLNEINEVIRDAQDLMARPRILVAEGSRVNPADIDNLTARIIKYTGIKPEALVWEAVSPELYAERDREVRSCFEQFGLPALVAQGKLPGQARLDSSAALQEATSIGDDRLADVIRRFEDFHLDLAHCLIWSMKSFDGDGSTTWYSGGRKGRAEVIKWSEVDMEDDAYTMNLEAASVFSMTPAARRDKLERDHAKGLITTEMFWEMDGLPDVENLQTLMASAREDIRRVIDLMEDGKYEAPSPMQDLVNGTLMVTQAYNRLKEYEDVSPKVLQNFVKWVSVARAVMRQGTQTPDDQGVTSVPSTSAAPPAMGMAGAPPPTLGMMGPGMAPGVPLV